MRLIARTFILAISLLLTPSLVHAQVVPQGVWTFGGSIGFSSSKQEGAGKAGTQIDILPEAGYFVIDDLGVGLNAIYSKTSQNGASLTEFGIGPWVRYYVYQNAFAQGSFLKETLTIDGDFGKAKSTGSKIEAALGYSAWLADAVALEPVIFVNLLNRNDENVTPLNTTTFGFRLGLKVFIGK